MCKEHKHDSHCWGKKDTHTVSSPISQTEDDRHAKGSDCVESEETGWRQWIQMTLSALLLVWGVAANPLPDLNWLIFLAAYLPVGVPIIREAAGEIARGDIFNEFTLMLLASIGAFGIGEYPEAVAVLLFYSLGEYFQDRAVGRARRDIQALVNLRPEKAIVIDEEGQRSEHAPESVRPGQCIEVAVGGRVPLDGELLLSAADFDTAALTGEAVPRTLTVGEEVQAGMIALDRVVCLKVLRPYGESALSRILAMVEDAAQRKSPAEMLMRRFARIYTPIVILLAIAIALLPPTVTGGEWSQWLYRSLIFLVISCPCALVVSIPLGYFRGIGVASRMGVLFKGGNYLDAVTRLRTIVFDKTGTLTQGRFAVRQVHAAAALSTDRVLQLAAALECHSTHPIARAITTVAAQPIREAAGVEEAAGLGLCGWIDGEEVLVGKAALLQKRHVTLPVDFSEDEAYTYVYVAFSGSFAGAIALRDEPKPEAAEAIRRLRAAGIRHTCMLSGDRSSVVEALSRELDINEAYGDLLPADKAAHLQRLKETFPDGGVAFVGDGINDAPVLAMSDVGFAMGGTGADAAVETADVVLQTDNPSRVADAIRIGCQTHRIVTANICLALGIKVAVMLLGALGLANLWAAVLADTGVALLCVANTYLIRK